MLAKGLCSEPGPNTDCIPGSAAPLLPVSSDVRPLSAPRHTHQRRDGGDHGGLPKSWPLLPSPRPHSWSHWVFASLFRIIPGQRDGEKTDFKCSVLPTRSRLPLPTTRQSGYHRWKQQIELYVHRAGQAILSTTMKCGHIALEINDDRTFWGGSTLSSPLHFSE